MLCPELPRARLDAFNDFAHHSLADCRCFSFPFRVLRDLCVEIPISLLAEQIRHGNSFSPAAFPYDGRLELSLEQRKELLSDPRAHSFHVAVGSIFPPELFPCAQVCP